MFDIGWSEMAIVMLIAVIVIGPKDLPKVARNVGKWTGKARAMARDFQRSLEDMARETELDEVKKTIDKAGRTNFTSAVSKAIDPKGELGKAFDVNEKAKPEAKAKSPDAAKSSDPAKPAEVAKPAEAVKPAEKASAPAPLAGNSEIAEKTSAPEVSPQPEPVAEPVEAKKT